MSTNFDCVDGSAGISILCASNAPNVSNALGRESGQIERVGAWNCELIKYCFSFCCFRHQTPHLLDIQLRLQIVSHCSLEESLSPLRLLTLHSYYPASPSWTILLIKLPSEPVQRPDDGHAPAGGSGSVPCSNWNLSHSENEVDEIKAKNRNQVPQMLPCCTHTGEGYMRKLIGPIQWPKLLRFILNAKFCELYRFIHQGLHTILETSGKIASTVHWDYPYPCSLPGLSPLLEG
jgi:hypothetical protein